MKWTKNGTAVIGIDHGYGNIKTANTVTPTGIIAYDSKPTFEGNILTYEGKYYLIGEGHKAFISCNLTVTQVEAHSLLFCELLLFYCKPTAITRGF